MRHVPRAIGDDVLRAAHHPPLALIAVSLRPAQSVRRQRNSATIEPSPTVTIVPSSSP